MSALSARGAWRGSGPRHHWRGDIPATWMGSGPIYIEQLMERQSIHRDLTYKQVSAKDVARQPVRVPLQSAYSLLTVSLANSALDLRLPSGRGRRMLRV